MSPGHAIGYQSSPEPPVYDVGGGRLRLSDRIDLSRFADDVDIPARWSYQWASLLCVISARDETTAELGPVASSDWTGWRMAVQGYAGAVSAKPGDKIKLFLNAPAGTATLTVQRYAGPESATLTTTVAPQTVPSTNAWTGYGWTSSPTSTFTIPSAFPSAYYRVFDGADVVAGFVVRAAMPGTTSKVLLSVDMLTNQAYNGAGGSSLYDPKRASFVSFNRPGGLPDTRELPIHDWLAGQGRQVECCAAQDLGTVDS